MDVIFYILNDIISLKTNKNKKHGKIFEISIRILLILGFVALIVSEIFIVLKLLNDKNNISLIYIALSLGVIIAFVLYFIIDAIKENYEIYKIKKQVKTDKNNKSR